MYIFWRRDSNKGLNELWCFLLLLFHPNNIKIKFLLYNIFFIKADPKPIWQATMFHSRFNHLTLSHDDYC